MTRPQRLPRPPIAARRRAAGIAAITVGVLSGLALVAVPAIATNGSGGSEPAHDRQIVVCESEVVDHGGGIRTSSASAERIATGAPVPEGCRAG